MFVLTLLSTMAFQTMPRIEMGMPRRIRFFISNVMNRGPGLQQIGNKMSRVGICSHQEDYVLQKCSSTPATCRGEIGDRFCRKYRKHSIVPVQRILRQEQSYRYFFNV
jgi:hypothetical protein